MISLRRTIPDLFDKRFHTHAARAFHQKRVAGPQEIVDLVEQRRNQMIDGVWDPFFEHAFVSNGTGLALEAAPIPDAGTEVKPAGEMPTDEWLLSLFSFDLAGVEILE